MATQVIGKGAFEPILHAQVLDENVDLAEKFFTGYECDLRFKLHDTAQRLQPIEYP